LSTEQVKEYILLVYTGARFTANKRSEELLACYYKITEEEFYSGESIDESVRPQFNLAYDGKKVKLHMRGSPGAVYKVEIPPGNDSSIYTESAKYYGHWKNKEQALKWDGQNTAVIAHVTAKKKDAKERQASRRASPLRVAVEPLRKMYQGTPYIHRAQLLAQIVEYLTHSAPLTEEGDD